jgi:hypothetical protein
MQCDIFPVIMYMVAFDFIANQLSCRCAVLSHCCHFITHEIVVGGVKTVLVLTAYYSAGSGNQ